VVLGFNFYSSFQVEANAEVVNVAGRQRMLSQRTTKALLQTQELYQSGERYDTVLQELDSASGLFNETLNAFIQGGNIRGTAGQASYLNAVPTEYGQETVRQAEEIWSPLYQQLQTIISTLKVGEQETASQSIQTAANLVESNNLQLLKLMNDLTIAAEADGTASEINLAGRQRMLSQRIAKSLFSLQVRYQNGDPILSTLNELANATALFDNTLNAFSEGGETLNVDGSPIQLEPFSAKNTDELIDQGLSVWQPIKQAVETVNDQLGQDVSAQGNSDVTRQIGLAANYARENINQVLKLMNDLTNEVERIASAGAETSRVIQIAGIILALLFFSIIMWRIFGQLGRADRLAAEAQQETEQIFKTVDQGLFLMDKDLSIGQQHSAELEDIFGVTEFKGSNFVSFIKPFISASDLEKVERYLKLVFDPSKKQQLIKDLNPLDQVPVMVEEHDIIRNKFLRFNFTRASEGNEVTQVLTSVADVTRQVELEAELEREAKRGEQQMQMISALVNADPDFVPVFVESSQKAYQDINALLKEGANSSVEYKQKAQNMMKLVHGVKGDATALSLAMVADTCHEFENNLQDVIDSDTEVDGNSFVPMTVSLNRLMSFNNTIERLSNSLFGANDGGGKTKTTASGTTRSWAHLHTLVSDIAERKNKDAQLELSGLDSPNFPEQLVNPINTISNQLIRNALSHGIELPSVREAHGKRAGGKISISIYNAGNDGYRYVFTDDGAGLDFDAIAKTAVERGIVSAEKAESMSRSDIANLIFMPEMSTVEEADMDSGRGAGMSLVKEIAKSVGGNRITIKSSKNAGTSFSIQFAA
jgi:HPt (histidine-containing phosphotransfer) domain-containing protein